MLSTDFLTSTINRSVEAGIPVVTWDSDAPNSKRVASTASMTSALQNRGRGSRPLTEIIAGRPPANPIIDSGVDVVDVVTPANLDAYIAMWTRSEESPEQGLLAGSPGSQPRRV